MPPGKPFPKISAEQRAAFNQAAKRDGLNLLRDLGRATVEHLQANPDSVLSQTVMAIERDTGALTMLVRGISAYQRECAVKPDPVPPEKQSAR